VQNGGGQQVKNVFLVADHDRMPGVIPALIPDRNITVLGKDIDQLSLPFIPPLRTDNDYIHRIPLRYHE
jgi:hypothetical protein